MLCDLEGGKWCAGCPQADAGPLCCSGGSCVVSDGKPCGGTLGWCPNFSTAMDPATKIEIATCHDGSM